MGIKLVEKGEDGIATIATITVAITARGVGLALPVPGRSIGN